MGVAGSVKLKQKMKKQKMESKDVTPPGPMPFSTFSMDQASSPAR